MTASVRTEIVDAARSLFKTVTGAPDNKVILAGEKGERPALPYVTVRTTTIGGGQGSAERINGLTLDLVTPLDLDLAVPNAKMRERREAVLSLQGYGSGSAVWLDAMQIGLDSPRSLAAQRTLGIAARLKTPVAELSALLDTAEEQRFSLELSFGYLYAGTVADQTPADIVEVHSDLRRFEDDPDMLSADQTVQSP